jgi:hypothetical protein
MTNKKLYLVRFGAGNQQGKISFPGERYNRQVKNGNWPFFESCECHCPIKYPVFSHKNGYMGLGSSVMQPGDLVCFLFGCGTPLIIRSIDNHCVVVGPCWIYGMMEGEQHKLGYDGFHPKQHCNFANQIKQHSLLNPAEKKGLRPITCHSHDEYLGLKVSQFQILHNPPRQAKLKFCPSHSKTSVFPSASEFAVATLLRRKF